MNLGAALRCRRPHVVPWLARRFLATNRAQRNSWTAQNPATATSQQTSKASKPKKSGQHDGIDSKRPTGPHRLRFNTSQASYKSNGSFVTTAENAAFFRETGIEPDNGLKWRMTSPEAKKIQLAAGLSLFYCDKYILNPVDLVHLGPDGSSRGPFIRAKYRRRLKEESLWVNTAAFSSDSAVVRHTATHRVAAIIHKAAEQLAERSPPIMVRGSVFAITHHPLKVVKYSRETLLQQLVLCLEAEMTSLDAKTGGSFEHGRPTRDRGLPRRQEAPDWNSLG